MKKARLCATAVLPVGISAARAADTIGVSMGLLGNNLLQTRVHALPLSFVERG